VQLLKESLERIGRQRGVADRGIDCRTGQPLEYRLRLRLQLRGDRLGFFGARSHDFVSVSRCRLASRDLWDAIETLQLALKECKGVAQCDSVEVRKLPGSFRTNAHFFRRKAAGDRRAFRETIDQLRARLGESFLLTTSDQVPALTDAEKVQLSPGVYGLVPPGGFIQVNPELNRRLIDEVLSVSRQFATTSALDLFCGFGNLSLPLAGEGYRVVGVEQQGAAIEAAALAGTQQELPVEFVPGDAHHLAERWSREGRTFDLVVVDPPRAGAKGMAQFLRTLCQKVLVMVSCDPATLARDLWELEQTGFALRTVLALDMFPQTHHVESLCVLTPSPRGDSSLRAQGPLP
jgi:23S rRNA (uracil1939-C5)-methyltransferase